MPDALHQAVYFDHCRIGSLEITREDFCPWKTDHCRIGSLEKFVGADEGPEGDHCRIGSLETSILPYG